MYSISVFLKKLTNFIKFPFFKKLVFIYLKSKNPLELSDLEFQTKFSNSYALISELRSKKFQKIINRLESYIGIGYFGPKKYWEYPWVLANLQLKKGMSILDVGCGTSPIQFLLSDLGCKVTGIDPYLNMKWHGINQKLNKRFNCDVKYHQGSGESVSFKDNTFDRVICVSVIEHCRESKSFNGKYLPLNEIDHKLQQKMLKEMIRVLKPGGLCVVTVDFFIPRNNLSLEYNINVSKLIESVKANMFGIKINEPFPGEPNFNFISLIENSDIQIVNYRSLIQTSIGFTLKK
ncbi:MAG: methyltransferase domain-containing protein [Promethearchaeota archaeon]